MTTPNRVRTAPNWAGDQLFASRALRVAAELIEQKKYREALDLLYDADQAQFRLRAAVSNLFIQQTEKNRERESAREEQPA
jgi:hypothetical protein